MDNKITVEISKILLANICRMKKLLKKNIISSYCNCMFNVCKAPFLHNLVTYCTDLDKCNNILCILIKLESNEKICHLL